MTAKGLANALRAPPPLGLRPEPQERLGHPASVNFRSLAHVLLELGVADRELDGLMNLFRELTDAEDARWTYLEDTIWLRKDEAKTMIEAATGVSWAQIEGANL